MGYLLHLSDTISSISNMEWINFILSRELYGLVSELQHLSQQFVLPNLRHCLTVHQELLYIHGL